MLGCLHLALQYAMAYPFPSKFRRPYMNESLSLARERASVFKKHSVREEGGRGQRLRRSSMLRMLDVRKDLRSEY